MEEALYDSESMRRFAGFSLDEPIPDETTILNFRHLLEEHQLTEAIFHQVTKYLEEQGLIVRKGTIVDATIIHAPSSTKNAEGERDPEMSSTKKGNQYYSGMKAHVGSDTRHGLVHGLVHTLVHTLVTTTASVHDSQVMEQLLHGDEKAAYGDKAYANRAKAAEYQAQGKAWRVAHKAPRGQRLSEHQELTNYRRSRVRAQGEHAFGLVKNTWKHRKVRYRGLFKNTCQLFSLFTLANLNMARYLLQDDAGQPLLQPR